MQRILLVEDDSSIVRSLTAFLAEEGFSAASAPGERRARELLCEESLDLLLVDISLADGRREAGAIAPESRRARS